MNNRREEKSPVTKPLFSLNNSFKTVKNCDKLSQRAQ